MDILGLLPLLLLLACPVVMALCLFGMRRQGCSPDAASVAPADAAGTVAEELTPAEQVGSLQQRLNWLQAEQRDLASRLQTLTPNAIPAREPAVNALPAAVDGHYE